MAWRDKLQPASFRGVGFHVESDTLSGGRRLQVHEYPQRDKPWLEDLGRKVREVSVAAFLVGPDYLDRLNALLGALEKGGPGTLVLPLLGSRTGCIADYSISHSHTEGGYCKVSFEFREDGELAYPEGSANPAAQTRQQADSVADGAADDFAAGFSIDGMPQFVADAAAGNLGDMISGISSAVDAAATGLSIVADLAAAMRDPRSLALRVLGVLLPESMLGRPWFQLYGSVNRLLGEARRLSGGRDNMPRTTPARERIYQNAMAVDQLGRSVAIAHAAGVASLLQQGEQQQLQDMRQTFAEALQQAAQAGPESAWIRTMRLRGQVVSHLDTVLRGSARLRTIELPESLPALRLAYEQLGDPLLGDAVATRNGVRHPGFMPPGNIKVLGS